MDDPVIYPNAAVEALGFRVLEEGGGFTWTTASGFPDYRSYTVPHPTDALDRIHYLSSYNLHWDEDNDVWTRDVADKAGFHMALESEWVRTIEWNLDHTLANSDAMRRVMEVRIDVDTGDAYWRWYTDPDSDMKISYGYGLASEARWAGNSAGSDVHFIVENTSAARAARTSVLNDSGEGIHLHVGGTGIGATAFGLPSGDTAFMYAQKRTALGTQGAYPLYFVTDSEIRGGIKETGEWFHRSEGVERPLVPYDLLFPFKRGVRYQSQFATTPATGTIAADTMCAAPFLVGRGVTVDRIALAVTTAAADCSIHLGIYAADEDGRPGTRVLNAGAADASTTGTREITVSQALQPGLHWLVVGAKGGAPGVAMLTGGGGLLVQQDTLTGTVRIGYGGTFADATLPAEFGTPTLSSQVPRILVRVQ